MDLTDLTEGMLLLFENGLSVLVTMVDPPHIDVREITFCFLKQPNPVNNPAFEDRKYRWPLNMIDWSKCTRIV